MDNLPILVIFKIIKLLTLSDTFRLKLVNKRLFIFLLTLNIVKCAEDFNILNLKSREDFENAFNRKYFYDSCFKIVTKSNFTEQFETTIQRQYDCLRSSEMAFVRFWNEMTPFVFIKYLFIICIYIIKYNIYF